MNKLIDALGWVFSAAVAIGILCAALNASPVDLYNFFSKLMEYSQ